MDDMAGTPILTGTTPIDSSEGIELETIATAANNDEESHDDRSESHGESLTTTSNESRVESLTASNEENDNTSSSQLRKELTLLDTISLVISQTIGAGIFITATQVFRYSGSVGLTLIIWFVGGLLSFAGGLTFIELGLLIKTSGGEYDYLREGYTFSKNRPVFLFIGNILSFSFSWYTILITRPASIAITTLSFGQYLAQAIAGGATPPDTAVKLLAISAIILIVLFNIYSLKGTAYFVTVTSVGQVFALLFIGALGVWQLISGNHRSNFVDSFEDTSRCPGEIALAFYSVMFAYKGWTVVGNTAEENKNLTRNLPLGMIIGLSVVTFCYIFVNVAYFAGLSKSEFLSSPATALTFAYVNIGDAGLVIVPLLVAVATIGAAIGTVYIASRTLFATSRDGNFLEMFSGIHNSLNTPVAATLFIGSVSILYISFGSIEHLINAIGSIELIYIALVYIALLIMRITRKQEKRPFKVWIILPIIMILVHIFLFVLPIILVPTEAIYIAAAIGLTLTSLPVYVFLIWDKWRPKALNKISAQLTKYSNMLLDSK